MAGFDNIVFPENIAYGSTSGPEYKTTVFESDSGSIQSVQHWNSARRRYTITKDDITMSEIAQLRTFYMGRRGRAYGFLYKDWEDYKAVDQQLVNSGTSTMQLIITYQDAIRPETRIIYKPKAGTVTLKKNGVAFTNFTVDANTGIVTLTGGPQVGTFTWSGEFYVPVQFASDYQGVTRESLTAFQWTQLELVEMRNPNA